MRPSLIFDSIRVSFGQKLRGKFWARIDCFRTTIPRCTSPQGLFILFSIVCLSHFGTATGMPNAYPDGGVSLGLVTLRLGARLAHSSTHWSMGRVPRRS